MRLVILPKNTEKAHAEVDILKIVAVIFTVLLCFYGVFPWWAFWMIAILSANGIKVKFRLER